MRYVAAGAAFVVVWLALGALFGPAHCADGWRSTSIGSRGACSWHGGVDRSSGALRLLGSVAAGAAAWYLVARRRQ